MYITPMINYFIRNVFLVFFSIIAISGCSSNNDDSTSPEVAVTGEIHDILPANVESYIAIYQAQRSRVVFTIDGIDHALTFEQIDAENNELFASYDDHLLIVGFDIDTFEPLPTMTLWQIEGGEFVNQRTGDNLNVETSTDDDYIYSGRLTDPNTDAEFEVNLVLNESLIASGNSTITVAGTDAFLNGDLGSESYVQMRNMINENPAVTRLVLQQSSGSVNDSINVHTGRLVRAANLATHVPAKGNINSGAVDLFAAGTNRSVEPGGILGVHSWCCKNGITADKLPISDPAHGTQLTYFREMLADKGEDFYFFTLQAASFDGIHQMTREELIRFGFASE